MMRGLGEKTIGTWTTFLLAGCLLALLVSPVLALDTSPALHAQASEGCWAPNVKVSDDWEGAWQGEPSVAVDGRGNAYAVWEDRRNGWPDTDIYFSNRPPGGSWTVNVRVNEGAPRAVRQQEPSIAVTPGGDAHVVWMDDRSWTLSYDIYSSFMPAGGPWGPNLRVNDDPGVVWQLSPSLAVDTSGNAYAVWTDGRAPSGDDIYFSYRPAGGSWAANTRLDDPVPGSQDSPDIVVDPAGNLYAIWSDRRVHTDCCRGDIYFSYRPAGGSWGANDRVDDAPDTTTQWRASIAVDSNGNAYAVWEDYRAGDPDIRFSYRAAGGSWTPSIQINDDEATAHQTSPSIVVDYTGNAYAVWQDRRDGNWDVYFSYRPTGGSWSTNIRVNDISAADQTHPDIAVDPAGRVYAVWGDSRNGDSDIYFSYWPTFPLGGLVWQDTDWNGIQQAGEPGVGGITVDLHATRDCGGAPVAGDVTDENGNYLFCVDPGTYCAEFSSIPQGWTFTSQDQGADDSLDSDANPATGRIRNIVIAEWAGDLDQDVGLQAAEEFVPELATLALLGGGLASLAGYVSLRRRC
jgi:hypothetical protein